MNLGCNRRDNYGRKDYSISRKLTVAASGIGYTMLESLRNRRVTLTPANQTRTRCSPGSGFVGTSFSGFVEDPA